MLELGGDGKAGGDDGEVAAVAQERGQFQRGGAVVEDQPHPGADKPAGGGGDVIARLIAKSLGERWGRQVVVDNRTGAGTMLGSELVARAAPDGYTLLVCTNAMLVINPHLSPAARIDALRDFAPVTLAASSPFLLVVHPAVPAKTTAELIAYARQNPRRLNYSSSCNGSATHMAGVLFQSMAKLDFTKGKDFLGMEVVIRLKDGRTVRHREAQNRGSDARPLSAAEIIDKFHGNAARAMSASRAQRVVDATLALDRAGDLTTLAQSLSA